jgi:hypothetical protein
MVYNQIKVLLLGNLKQGGKAMADKSDLTMKEIKSVAKVVGFKIPKKAKKGDVAEPLMTHIFGISDEDPEDERLTDEVVNWYNVALAIFGGDEEEPGEEEESEESEEEEEEEEDEEEEEGNGIGDLSRKELKTLIKKEELDIKVTKKMSDEDICEAIIEARATDEEEEEDEEEEAPPKKKKVKKVAKKVEAPAEKKAKKKAAATVETTAYGHRPNTMSGAVDSMVEKGTTLAAAVKKLSKNFGRTEEKATAKFLIHVKHLQNVKGIKIKIDEKKQYYKAA